MENIASVTSSTTDPDPKNNTAAVTVRVDAPPVASFTFSPATPVVDEPVTFDGSGSTDNAPIANHAWQFGDSATETGVQVAHVYSAVGSYTVTLTVTDALGATDTTTREVVVVNPSPEAAHRALRGTVSQVLEFGPGMPATASEPLAGARVRVSLGGSQSVQTVTDASGAYAFTNLTCPSNTCTVAVSAPGSTTILLQTSVALGPDPSTTVRDFLIGTGRDQLYVTGQVLPPLVDPGDPQPPEPLTVGIRVYRGNNLLVDSATTFGGPGGRGAYQLLVGRAGTLQLRVGDQLRVVLVENGVEGAQTTIEVPPLSGTFAPLVVTAADLVGQ
jgi:PKD repeat protein